MFKKLKGAYDYVAKKQYDTFAGTLSFFFVLSCVPIAYITLFLYNLIATKLDLELPEIIKNLTGYLTFETGLGVSIIFILSTIYSTSKFFVYIRKTGEIIYEEKNPTHSIKTKIIAVVVSLVFILILVAGLLVLAFSTKIFGSFPPWLVQILTILIIGVVFYFLITVIDRMASPKTDIREDVHKGALLTVGCSAVMIGIYYIYIHFFASFTVLYGYLTTILLFLLWVYLIMKCVVIGIVVNFKNDTDEKRRKRIERQRQRNKC